MIAPSWSIRLRCAPVVETARPDVTPSLCGEHHLISVVAASGRAVSATLGRGLEFYEVGRGCDAGDPLAVLSYCGASSDSAELVKDSVSWVSSTCRDGLV